MTVSAKNSVTAIRDSSKLYRILKNRPAKAVFVSGQEITPDPPDPSIPLLIRSANLHPVDVRQQPKIAVLQFLERKRLRERGNMLNSPIYPLKSPLQPHRSA